MTDMRKTVATRLGRNPGRGSYDSDSIYGVLPSRQVFDSPIADGRLKAGVRVPDYLRKLNGE